MIKYLVLSSLIYAFLEIGITYRNVLYDKDCSWAYICFLVTFFEVSLRLFNYYNNIKTIGRIELLLLVSGPVAQNVLLWSETTHYFYDWDILETNYKQFAKLLLYWIKARFMFDSFALIIKAL